MIFYPKICWFTRFVVNCRESNLRTFCREIHQSAKIGGRGGEVKPILAMPGFWELFVWQPLPECETLKKGKFLIVVKWENEIRKGFHDLCEYMIAKPSICQPPTSPSSPGCSACFARHMWGQWGHSSQWSHLLDGMGYTIVGAFQGCTCGRAKSSPSTESQNRVSLHITWPPDLSSRPIFGAKSDQTGRVRRIQP